MDPHKLIYVCIHIASMCRWIVGTCPTVCLSFSYNHRVEPNVLAVVLCSLAPQLYMISMVYVVGVPAKCGHNY